MLLLFCPPDGDWKVWVVSLEDAMDGDIALVVYGDKGNSGPVILGSAGENGLFMKGNKDIFKVGYTCIYTSHILL